MLPVGGQLIRAVTHFDVGRADVEQAGAHSPCRRRVRAGPGLKVRTTIRLSVKSAAILSTKRGAPMSVPKWFLPAVAVLLSLVTVARGDDAYFRVALPDLDLTEGKLPAANQSGTAAVPMRAWQFAAAMRPYAVLDGKGEAYVARQCAPLYLLHAHSGESAPARNLYPRPLGRRCHRLARRSQDRLFRHGPAQIQDPRQESQRQIRTRFLPAESAALSIAAGRGDSGGRWFRHEERLAESRVGPCCPARPRPTV